jgi:hypothetical protein
MYNEFGYILIPFQYQREVHELYMKFQGHTTNMQLSDAPATTNIVFGQIMSLQWPFSPVFFPPSLECATTIAPLYPKLGANIKQYP